MQSALGDATRIIRTMPNTPAMIGQGMTVWSQSAEVTDEQHALVRACDVGLLSRVLWCYTTSQSLRE